MELNNKKNEAQNFKAEEWLDLVNEQDQVMTSVPRSVVYEQKLFSQMRSVWLMLRNSQGQLWIPRRSYSKSHLPGYLDGSVAGHVSAGEDYESAMIREAVEEIGLDMRNIKYRLLGKITPIEDHAFCFVQVYEAVVEQAPENWNRQEFCEWFWLTPQEILRRAEDGDKYKDILILIVKKFYIGSN